MTAHVKVGGTWKALVGLHVKVGGTWKEVSEAFVKVGGAWKQAYINFTASASDTTPSGSDNGMSETGVVTSAITTITPVGGTSPYTYAWAQGPGGAADSGPYTAVAPTGQATAFTSTVSSLDGDKTEDWTCTITDDDANEITVTVAVTLTWVDTT